MTQIIDIAVDWMDGFANDPKLRVLLDRAPNFGPYEKLPIEGEREKLYIARDGDLATFFVWAGKPDDGFGGWARDVRLADGSTERVVGGWSSRGEVASSVVGESLIDSAYVLGYDADGQVMRGGTVVHVRKPAIVAALANAYPHLELVREMFAWTVRPRGGMPKTQWLSQGGDVHSYRAYCATLDPAQRSER